MGGSASLATGEDGALKPFTPRNKLLSGFQTTGCITCRFKRDTCDEDKPHCNRCRSIGRKCDGYTIPHDLRYYGSPFRPYSIPESSSVPSCRAEELVYFDFFKTVTGPELAGYFDFDFWNKELLQASRMHPALWYAITALGAMHQRFVWENNPNLLPNAADSQTEFALAQFNTSLKHLIQPLEGPSPTDADKLVMLTACILFTCLASLQGQRSQTYVHIRSGLKLSRDWKIWEMAPRCTDSPISVEMVSAMLTRLDTQARILLGNPSKESWEPKPLLISGLRAPFGSVVQAYIHMENLFNGLLQIAQKDSFLSSTDYPVTEMTVYRKLFDAWDTRFADYVANNDVSKLWKPVVLLRLQRLYADLLLRFDPAKGELAWDEFEPHFTEIVDIVARVLAIDTDVTDEDNLEMQHRPSTDANTLPTSQTPTGRPVFSLATWIPGALYVVAMRCREPTIRRRALSLLKAHPRTEGIWGSTLAGKIAEAGILIEESACPRSDRGSSSSRSGSISSTGASPLTDESISSSGGSMCSTGSWVCESHRVHLVDQTLIGDRQARVSIWTVEDVRLKGPGTKILVSW